MTKKVEGINLIFIMIDSLRYDHVSIYKWKSKKLDNRGTDWFYKRTICRRSKFCGLLFWFFIWRTWKIKFLWWLFDYSNCWPWTSTNILLAIEDL